MPNVMIVDDTRATRETLARLLRRHGYDATGVASGVEALDALAGRTPDLILLDLDMPEADGLDLLEHLSRHPRWSTVPVVVLAGVSDTHTVRRAERLGARDHMVKAAFSVHEMMGAERLQAVAANPYLGEQLVELRLGVDESMRKVADGLQYAVGQAYAADLLAQWEGFGRLCRDVLGVEPLVLTAAFGLGRDDPAAMVLAAYLQAAVDEAAADRRAKRWTGTWRRRFG
jgi:CheY-like chemotaxis protein